MKDRRKTKGQLINEIKEFRQQLLTIENSKTKRTSKVYSKIPLNNTRSLAKIKLLENEQKIRNKLFPAFFIESDTEMYSEVGKILLKTFKSKTGLVGYFDLKGDLVCSVLSKTSTSKDECSLKEIIIPKKEISTGIWKKSFEYGKSHFNNRAVNVRHIPDKIKTHIITPLIFGEKKIGIFLFGNKTGGYQTSDKKLLDSLIKYISPVFYNRLERNEIQSTITNNTKLLNMGQQIARIASWEWNPDTNQVLWSNELFNLLGFKVNEIEPSFEIYFNLIHPDDHEIANDNVNNILNNSEFGPYQYRIIRKDGIIRIFESKTKCIYGKNNKVIKVIGFVQDVTTRKLITNSLKKSESKFRALVESSSDWIWEVDTEGNYIYSSPQIENITGYKPEELIGKSLFSLISSKELPKIIDAFKEVIKNKSTVSIEKTIVHKNGQNITLETRGVPAFDENGKFSGYRGINRDITNRKKFEKELIRSENNFRLLFKNIAGGVVVIDDQHIIQEVNDETCNMTGFKKEELIGQPYHILFPKESASQECPVLGQEKNSFNGMDTLIKCKDGSKISILKNAKTLTINNKLLIFENFQDISKQKDIEKELRDNKDRYRILIENLPQKIFAKNKNSVYLSCNSNFSSDLSKNPEDIIGKTDFDFYPKNIAEKYQIDDQTILSTGKILTLEERSIQNDKEIFSQVVKAPLKDIFGNITGILGIYWDISKRKEVEKALLRSEERYRSLFEQAPESIFIVNFDGIVLDCNFDKSLTGYNREEIIGKRFDDLPMLNPNPKLYSDFFVKILKGNKKPFELNLTSSNGDKFWVEVIPSIVIEENNKYIRLMFTDITERKHSEKALIDSEKRYRNFIANSSEGIYRIEMTTPIPINISDSELIDQINKFAIIKEVNEALARMYGLQMHDMIGKPVIKFVPDYGKRAIKVLKDKLLQVQNEATEDIDINGDPIYLKESFHGEISNNQLIRIWGVQRNVTKQKISEKEKTNLEKQLRHSQKIDTIGTLAGGIAHDFNNILGSIMGYTEISLFNLDKTNPMYTDLKNVIAGVHRAKDLIEQILLFSRQIEKEQKHITIHLIVFEALKLIRPTIPSTIEINHLIDPSCCKVSADASQIHQVIVNLCTNAWQSMENHGGTMTLELKQVEIDHIAANLNTDLKEGSYVRFSVKDTGSGIDPETLEHIFEPFFTTKSTDKGTGLGLSVVHGIIKSHNGAITVKSEPGNGSLFQVFLPAVQIPVKNTENSKVRFFSGNERILIVDDDKSIGNMIQQMLERFGYQTEYYSDSLEALKNFRQKPDDFDLVISDLTMPNMTGLVLTEEIHKIRFKLPVLIITGYGDSITNETQKQYGINKVIGKPIVMRDFSIDIRNALDRSDS